MSTPPTNTLNIRPLALRLVGVLACSCALAAGLMAVLLGPGGADATLTGPTGGAAALGAGVIFVAGLIGLGAMVLIADGTPYRVPVALLACSSIRLLAGAGIGLVLFLATQPSGRPFWFAFLAAGLVSLALETLICMAAVRRLDSPGANPEAAR